MTAPLKIKAVLVAMFQPQENKPGELTHFIERDRPKPLDLLGIGFGGRAWLSSTQILYVELGMGTVQAAVSALMLGHADLFDFTDALWLISGIAGGNPHYVSLGSTVWADHCVDGDFAFEIDGRELPSDWDTGIFPFGGKKPYDEAAYATNMTESSYMLYRLNPELVEWARKISEGVEHVTSSHALEETLRYPSEHRNFDHAINTVGTVLSAARFWHGEKMNDWAERWATFWTKGASRFLACGMEDSGTLHALRQLGKIEKVNPDRILLLRSISNFTLPPPGVSAVANLVSDADDAHFPGYYDALENGYRICRKVLDEWVG